MKILVGCECSGVVRDAFIRYGHEAMSCDIKASETSGPHYTGNVFDVIDYPWDIAIFHPECTHLSVSGAHLFKKKRMDGRQQKAVSFFMRLVRRSSHIEKRAFENPVGIMSTLLRKPEQIIQPYHFGDNASKATCLWLYNLEPLKPTKYIEPRIVADGKKRWENQTDSGQNRLGPSDTRSAQRACTYNGIAEAMASQWGGKNS